MLKMRNNLNILVVAGVVVCCAPLVLDKPPVVLLDAPVVALLVAAPEDDETDPVAVVADEDAPVVADEDWPDEAVPVVLDIPPVVLDTPPAVVAEEVMPALVPDEVDDAPTVVGAPLDTDWVVADVAP